MINKLINLVIIFIIVVSCDNRKKVFYDNGELKQVEYEKNKGSVVENYTEKGVLKSVVYFNNNNIIDSSFLYHNNITMVVNKRLKGNYYSTIEFDSLGRQVLYGHYIRVRGKEFLIGDIEKRYLGIEKMIIETYNYLGDSTALNQRRLFEKGKLIRDVGDYIDISLEDTIELNKVYDIKVKHYIDPKRYKSYSLLCLSDDLNSNFDNLEKVNVDTLPSIDNNEWNIKYKALSKGKKNFRGFMINNEWEKVSGKKDTYTRVYRNIYFDKEIYVK